MPENSGSNTVTGLDVNVAAALSYVFGPVSGLLFLLLEKNSFIRFHALQSILVLGGLVVLDRIFSLIMLGDLGRLIWLIYFVLLLVFAHRASIGERWQVPYLKQYTNRILRKV